MKRLIITIALLAVFLTGVSAVEYTNKSDHYLSVGFMILDENAILTSNDFDSVIVHQVFNGVTFLDTVLSTSNTYEVSDSLYGQNSFNIYNANIRASNAAGSTGVYSCYILGIGTDGAHTYRVVEYNVVDSAGSTVNANIISVNTGALEEEDFTAAYYENIADTMLLNAAAFKATDVNVASINANAIGVGDIASGAITADAIATDAIGAAEIAANAIGASEIAADAIGASELAAGCITSSEIAASAIGASQLAANCITTSEIATGAIEAADFTADFYKTVKDTFDLSLPDDSTGLIDGIWSRSVRTLSTADWTTDADITTLKSDLATDHGAGSWQTATSVTVSDKTGFSLAAGDLTISKFAADWDDSVLAIINNQTKTGFSLASTGLNGVTQASGSVIVGSGTVTDVTNTVTFDNTSIATVTSVGTVTGNVDGSVGSVTGKVTLVDSSAGDISYIANNAADYKATGFSTHSAADVLAAIKADMTTTGTGIDSAIYAYFIYSTREDQFKGAGTGATAQEVWEYAGPRVLTSLNPDTTNIIAFVDSLFKTYIVSTDYAGDLANDSAQFAFLLFVSGDSTLWASVADVWQNVDTANTIDTSDIGAWFTNALAGLPASTWTYAGGNRTLSGAQAFNLTGNITGSITSVTGNVGGNVTGSVGSVAGNVSGNVTGSVGSISGITFPGNFADLNITASTGLVRTDLDNSAGTLSDAQVDNITVTAGTVSDKAGYSLTQSFPTNFASMGITAGGYVSPNWSDINGILNSSEIDSAGFGLRVWSYDISALTGNTAGGKLNSAASAGDPWSTSLPGTYVSNQAGWLVGTYLDLAVSTARANIMAAIGDSSARAFSDSGYTEARAGKLDSLQYLDAAISGVTATIPDSTLGDVSYIANNQSAYQANVSALALEATVAALNDPSAADIYAEFISGSNEEVFWGTASLTAIEIADTLAGRGMIFSGTGEFACTLIVLNSVDTTAIQSAWITTYSSDGGTKYTRWYTDVNGSIIFWLDAEDSVIYYAVKAGVSFTVPEYISIAAAQTDTIWGEVLTPSAATGDMVALQFYQLTPGYDSLYATEIQYRLVKSDSSEYDIDDRLTFGTGASTITLSKSFYTAAHATGDSSYVNFDVFSNWDIYVNGVQDSSSRYEFLIEWLNGEETRIIDEIDSTSVQNPAAP